MKHILTVLLLSVLFGCSHVPNRQENPQCVKVANYARTVATLHNVGVSEDDLVSFTSMPVAVTYPYKLVQQAVYNTEGTTPAEAFVIFYDKCDQTGYDNLLQALKEDERKRIEAAKKAESDKTQAQELENTRVGRVEVVKKAKSNKNQAKSNKKQAKNLKSVRK